jgi:hypothetical protein
LRLFDPTSGAALDLIAAWPARHGVMLGPDGARLVRNQAISVDALTGWRAIAPEGAGGKLQISLRGQAAVALPASGETQLGAHVPLIRTMLAQGGPDAQVDLRLVVGGDEGRRLEVRRYEENAVERDGLLYAGLARDVPIGAENALISQPAQGLLTIHAVDLSDPKKMIYTSAASGCDLVALLGREGGPWLIQSLLEGRRQRAVFFAPSLATGSQHEPTSPRPGPKRAPAQRSQRETRIAAYARKIEELVASPEDAASKQLWMLIEALTVGGGDAGVADQVQALAKAPAAAIVLALRAPRSALADVLGLDMAAPIFWPTLSVDAFVRAVRVEFARQEERWITVLGKSDAAEEAGNAVMRRTSDILAWRPELGAHFGKALTEVELIGRVLAEEGLQTLRDGVIVPDPAQRLAELAQEAARRFDRLPLGLRPLAPSRRREGLQFQPDRQAVIDAPIVAAEMSAGLRPAPIQSEVLSLIHLRLVDPVYFDEALPAAGQLHFKRERGA